ncbi:MAG: translation initiation inhibitor, partial [Acidimicrobiales bacterium]|nr:translation initiation inhibitor [Acidimicrobiales bacterium]
MDSLIEAVESSAAAAPAAHYSQAVRAGDRIWTAGAVGVDPATGEVAPGVEAQMHRAIENVQATLRAAGSDLDHVVKTTCFVTRREDFARLDPVYRQYFPRRPPARTTIVCGLVREELLFEI